MQRQYMIAMVMTLMFCLDQPIKEYLYQWQQQLHLVICMEKKSDTVRIGKK